MSFLARFFAVVLLVLFGFGWVSAQTKNAPTPKPTQVTGSGTTNAIPLWTSLNTIGNSVISQSGSNVGVAGSVAATSFTGDGKGLTNVNAVRLGGFLPSDFVLAALYPPTSATHLYLSDFLSLPDTSSSTTGVIMLGGDRFLHDYGVNGWQSRNTFVGKAAGNFAMSGMNNTGIGAGALINNTTGNENTATGTYALVLNTQGFANTANGSNVLRSNTTGDTNTAIGAYVLQSNTTGYSNTGTGAFVLSLNTTGVYNTAIGNQALMYNTTGFENTAIGEGALQSNTTAIGNTATGMGSLAYNTTGNYNIAVGVNAGFNLTTGDSNIDIGNTGVAGESATIRIGTSGIQNATFIAGISTATAVGGVGVYVNSDGQLGVLTSSRRYKEQIVEMGNESDMLMKLRPVAFYYRPEYDSSHTRQYGLVAEEVAEIAPELVVFGKDGKPDTVRYQMLPPMLLNEVQKQHAQIETLVEENKKLRQQLQSVLLQLEQIRGK